MKLGIISDIHGDRTALETALKRFERVHQVDQVLCAGDLLGGDPAPAGVVRLVREHRIVTVRGNHDDSNSELTREDASFLNDLPMDWEGTRGGCRIYMCHGKPGNNIWGLYRDHLSDTLLNMMLRSLNADVLVTGAHASAHVRPGGAWLRGQPGLALSCQSQFTGHLALLRGTASAAAGVRDLRRGLSIPATLVLHLLSAREEQP